MYEQFHIDHKTSLMWNMELIYIELNSLIFSWSANSCSWMTILDIPQGMKGLSDLSTKYKVMNEYKNLTLRIRVRVRTAFIIVWLPLSGTR